MRNLFSLIAIVSCLLVSVSCKEDESEPIPPAAVRGDEIIEDITAGSGLSLYTLPSISFITAIGQSTTVEGDAYRAVLDEVKLYKDGNEIAGTFTLSSDSKSGKFAPNDLLPSESTLKLVAKTHWEVQFKEEWITVIDQG